MHYTIVNIQDSGQLVACITSLVILTFTTMANQSDSSSVFDLLREYDVELSPQVQLMLQKFKFNSVRTILMIDLEKLDLFENDVRTLFASDEELSNMSQEQKIALFGEYFANKPQQFRLLAGETCGSGFA